MNPDQSSVPAAGERRAALFFQNVYREEYNALLTGLQPFTIFFGGERAPEIGALVTVRELDDASGEKTGREFVADVTATREATSATVVALARRPAGLAGFREQDYRAEVLRNCPQFDAQSLEKKLSLGGLGVAGEGGEVADVIKKVLHHDVAVASVLDKLKKEMGDVYWYLEFLGATLGWTREEILAANVQKLRLRHPNGWTPASQQAKADEV